MRRHNDDYNETWFSKLDAIVMGRETPSQEDDDLLHVAAKLSHALSPLNKSSTQGVQNPHLISTKSLQQYTNMPVRSKKRLLLTAAMLLFVLFGIVRACPSSIQVSASTQNVGRQIWQAATSFEQIDASSVAFLAVKRAGVLPLLPVVVPVDTQSVEFGIITDTTNAQDFVAFVANYRIAEQNVSVYEQAANLIGVTSTAAKSIMIDTRKGNLFQDNAGNSILQWYQNGMTCQVASTLPVNELVTLTRQFHPITQWEFII